MALFSFPTPMLVGAAAVAAVSKCRLNCSAVQAAGSNWLTIAEMEMRAVIGGSTVTSGGTASASASAGGTPASNAFDGNPATVWQTGTATMPQWLEYDFPTAQTIKQVSIRGGPTAGDCPASFSIQHWNGTTWQTDWSETSPDWGANYTRIFTQYDSLTSGYFKWRLSITSTKGGGTAWTGISEIELRTSIGGADATSPISSSNPGDCLGTQFSSSPLSNAFDNNTSTVWQSGTDPSVSVPVLGAYRFPTQTVVAEVAITNSGTLGDSPKAVDIQYFDPLASGGAGAWVTARSIADCGFTATGQTLAFSVP